MKRNDGVKIRGVLRGSDADPDCGYLLMIRSLFPRIRLNWKAISYPDPVKKVSDSDSDTAGQKSPDPNSHPLMRLKN